MERVKIETTATAWQYTEEAAQELRELKLPTGEIVIQDADEMNGVTPRCYVPVGWGTHILEPGDWILLTEDGVVLTVRAAAKDKLTRPLAEMEQVQQFREGKIEARHSYDQTQPPRVLLYAVDSFGAQYVDLVEETATEHRLDWEIKGPEDDRWELQVRATGRVLGSWATGDTVLFYKDGGVEIQ